MGKRSNGRLGRTRDGDLDRRSNRVSSAELVLVLTGQDDPMWPFVREACTPDQRPRLLLFPTDCPERARLSLDPVQGRTRFVLDGHPIDGSQVRAIWLRRAPPPALLNLDDELRRYCEQEYEYFFDSLEIGMAHALWVSKPHAIQRANNKALQLRTAARLNFAIGSTVFTNDPNELRRLLGMDRHLVYKSLRHPRVPVAGERRTVFTSRIDGRILEHAEGLTSCPAILQEFCDKQADVRVTVFGSRAFAVRIDSQAGESSRTDFRFGARNLRHEQYPLPAAVELQCVRLVAELGLHFGAIDLGLSKEDTYVFFEVNPNGQWGWLEERTNLPMRRALLDLLFFGSPYA
jgi:glutathione synthase/RimK-type ligase-like ATP-grasp enzyme